MSIKSLAAAIIHSGRTQLDKYNGSHTQVASVQCHSWSLCIPYTSALAYNGLHLLLGSNWRIVRGAGCLLSLELKLQVGDCKMFDNGVGEGIELSALEPRRLTTHSSRNLGSRCYSTAQRFPGRCLDNPMPATTLFESNCILR